MTGGGDDEAIARQEKKESPGIYVPGEPRYSANSGPMTDGGDNEAIPRQEKEERNPSLIASGN